MKIFKLRPDSVLKRDCLSGPTVRKQVEDYINERIGELVIELDQPGHHAFRVFKNREVNRVIDELEYIRDRVLKND